LAANSAVSTKDKLAKVETFVEEVVIDLDASAFCFISDVSISISSGDTVAFTGSVLVKALLVSEEDTFFFLLFLWIKALVWPNALRLRGEENAPTPAFALAWMRRRSDALDGNFIIDL
jgi:hypothetical protein